MDDLSAQIIHSAQDDTVLKCWGSFGRKDGAVRMTPPGEGQSSVESHPKNRKGRDFKGGAAGGIAEVGSQIEEVKNLRM